MDKLSHPLSRAASWLLIYLTAAQPLHPAIAAGITAANTNTRITGATVPVVNIATPNSAGVSHNTYKDFNVAVPGAVLNNATGAATSQLAGQLAANSNLKGKGATLIINEVTGSGASELKGKLEVAGNKASVMIANPNGITCDGCGFINSPGVTLTTGKPTLDNKGALDAIEVKKGSVIIGANSLDGNATEYVDVISRATELNGKINGRTLNITQGANRISYKDGSIRPVVGEGTKPVLAVDTKALGGMYANKIRLVATEAGVGVNLNNVSSKLQDVTLTSAGKITLGNVQAKTDLNVSARDILNTAGTAIKSGRDMTLAASSALDNQGSAISAGDMRVFANTVRNTGNSAVLQGANNLWIQKDAQGNKSALVENRSARIQTTSGDLIIRANKLENTVTKVTTTVKNELPTQANVEKNDLGWLVLDSQTIGHFKGAMGDGEPKTWYGAIDYSNLNAVNTAKTYYTVVSQGNRPLISSGKNLYINSGSLINRLGDITATHNAFLTGSSFTNEHFYSGEMSKYYTYSPEVFDFNTDPKGIALNGPMHHTVLEKKFTHSGEVSVWTPAQLFASRIQAGGDLVADYTDSYTSNVILPATAGYAIYADRAATVSAKNVLLHAGTINSSDVINAAGNITLQSDKNSRLALALLSAGQDISTLAGGALDVWQSELKGQNLTLVSRSGSLTAQSSDSPLYLKSDGEHWQTRLEATGDLSLTAGNSILLKNVTLPVVSKNIALVANNDVVVQKSDALLDPVYPGFRFTPERAQVLFNNELALSPLRASADITISGGRQLMLNGVGMQATGNISLASGNTTYLNMRTLDDRFSNRFPTSRSAELRSNLSAGKNIIISAGENIGLQGASVYTGNTATFQAGNLISAGAYGYGVTDSANDNNRNELNVLTSLRGRKGLTLAANTTIQAVGSSLSSDGNITLTSGGNMRFEAAKKTSYKENGNAWTETVGQTGVTLNAGGALTVISGGSVLFQATRLIAAGAMDVAAKGGWLYAQAVEESSHYEKKTTTRKWWGKKTTVKKTKHTTTNRVTEFVAGGNINLLSRDDSTYEASKIQAGKNATLTSTNGKVNFLAVKNTSFQQTVSTSKGFYVTQANKGYTAGKWVLPSVYTGGKLTVDAASGITADVKTRNGQALQGAITALGAQAGTTWLSNLNKRSDVQWNAVKDAYDGWNYKSQKLNPAVAAVIAIAAAAVTAGSSLTATVASSVQAAGGGAMATGSVTAGMSSLASQAAVALVENQGNLSKTLKALGNSSAVKALATSMVIGGALAGFDDVMNVGVSPDKARLPALVRDEGWSKITQRVAGQSVISSSLNTTINGGSFKDNLTTALLSNIGNQINAEGAGLIGDNGEILGLPGRTLSHAVVSGVSAEIGGGNGKGAAAGALAAELAGVVMQSSLFEPANLNEKERQLNILKDALNGNPAKEQTARFVGGLVGALTTHTPEGANSGADSAQSVYRYNMTEHMLQQYALDNQRDILAASQGDKVAAQRVKSRREAGLIALVAGAGGAATTAAGFLLVSATPELLLAAQLTLSSCRTAPVLCLNQAGIFAADAIAPEAVLGTGAIASGTTLVVGQSKEGLTNFTRQINLSVNNLVSNGKFSNESLTTYIKGEAVDYKLSDDIIRYLDSKGVSLYPTGINFSPNQLKHIATLDGFSQKRGVAGAHNSAEFDLAVKQYGLQVVKVTPTTTPGINNVTYLIPAKDAAGNNTGAFKGLSSTQPFTKTVYDASYFSNQTMLDLGQEAAARGYQAAMKAGARTYDSVAGGVSFRVYLDLPTGRVLNFHPN